MSNLKYTKQDAEKFYKMYENYSITVNSVCSYFKIKNDTLVKLLKRHGYEVRPKGFRPNNCRGVDGEDSLRLRYLWFKNHSYLRRCKSKDREFKLTDNEFIDLVTGDCFYCGKSHKTETRKVNGVNINMLTIDRLDSNKGYITDNCVTSCKICNTMKMDTPYNEFIKHIKLISSRLV